MELIETSTFTKQITALLTDEEYSDFQLQLAANPQLAALIKGAQLARVAKEEFGNEK